MSVIHSAYIGSDSELEENKDNERVDYILFHDNNANIFHLTLFEQDLSLKQRPSARNLGHGAVVWEASVIFAKYMEIHCKKFSYHKLQGKTVVELGSGVGLGGLSFMMRGAEVVLSDLKCVTDTLTRDNAEVLFIIILLIHVCLLESTNIQLSIYSQSMHNYRR